MSTKRSEWEAWTSYGGRLPMRSRKPRQNWDNVPNRERDDKRRKERREK